MKTMKNMKIVPPSKTSGMYETPADCPVAGQVCIAVGKRKSGKSVAVINLIEKMKFDYCIAISPTMNSNKEIMERINIEYVFDDVDDPNVIDEIKKIVQQEAEDLERYREELKRFNKLMKDLKDGNYINDQVLLQFYEKDAFVKPTHRWNGENLK
jgi:hypothetical protein